MAFSRIFGTGFEMGSIEVIPSGDRSAGVAVTNALSHSGAYSMTATGLRTCIFREGLGGIHSELYVSFWAYPTQANTTNFLFFTVGGQYLGLSYSGTTWNFYRSGSLIASGGIATNVNTWVMIEIHVVIDNTTGVFQTKIDGTLDINFTGDTQPGASSLIDYIQFRWDNNGQLGYFDDITYGTGGWPGDIRYAPWILDGDTGTINWTASGGGSNYADVDEIPPSDADYVSTINNGDEDIYTGGTTLSGETVLGVQIWVRAKKDPANSQQIQIIDQEGVSKNTGPAESLLTTYSYIYKYLSTAPDGTPWNDAHVAALEVGIKAVI